MPDSDEETMAHEARFLALISGLSSSVMQHLGKIVNPLTGNIERDLDTAKATIDLLRTLKEKTKGNLTNREERTFNALLSGVQMNYLDELKAEAEKPKEKPEEKPTEVKQEAPPQKKAAPPGDGAGAGKRKEEAPSSKPHAEQGSEATSTQEGKPGEEESGKARKKKDGR